MKDYKVYYVLKMNGHGYLHSETVKANTQRDAIVLVKEFVRQTKNRNAFCCTCNAPVKTKEGLQFNGGTYTRYSEFFGTLW